jgi:hypothetical protein
MVNFDDEVREKLRVRDEASKAYLSRFERLLMQLTRIELADCAEFIDDSSFRLKSTPFSGDFAPGLYELPRRTGEAHLYRLNHPLADAILQRAKDRPLAPAEVDFDYGQHDGKVSILEPLRGRAGWLTQHGEEEDDDRLARLRRLLAMGVGRARESVILGYKPSDASRLVEYLDEDTYEAVDV